MKKPMSKPPSNSMKPAVFLSERPWDFAHLTISEKREKIIKTVSILPEKNQIIFRRMYEPHNEFLAYSIRDIVVKYINDEKVNWALKQATTTLNKLILAKDLR